jgi:hypothetical protein
MEVCRARSYSIAPAANRSHMLRVDEEMPAKRNEKKPYRIRLPSRNFGLASS